MKKLQYIFLTSMFFLIAFNCINAQTVYTVTKTSDPDPFVYPYKFDDSECDPEMLGTLQWAIRKSNDTGGACIINFDIETPAPYKIRLNNYLPVIDSRITLDGTTQAGYVEGTPIINIEANTHITTCFSAYGVDELTIKGFSFHNFIACGISLENCNYSTISDNIVTLLNSNFLISKIGLVRIRLINCTNIDVYNNQLLTLNDGSPINGPDNYGIAIYNSENCTIGADLNSNIIEDCATGIMLDDSQNIRLIQNEIYGGTSSILLNNGSNSNKREPFLLSYDGGTLNGVAQANDIIEVFGSDDEDDATAYLGTAIADDEGKWSLETTNEYFFFTATATDANNNTSELCNVGTTNSICSKPFNVTATPGINTTHTLLWESENPDSEFQIAVGIKGISALENEWVFAYTTVTGNSITLNGFDENTVYEFYVQEICENGVGHFVGPVDFNFINNPIITTQLIAEDCGAIDIFLDQTLTAEEIVGADSYEFLIENTSLGYYKSIIKSFNTFTLNEFPGIDYNRTYNIQVRTIVGIDTSNYGDVCQIQTKYNPLLLTNGEGHSLHGTVIDSITGKEYTPPMYVYDRFGDSTLLENIRIPDNSEIAGLFRLHFIDDDNNTDHGFNDPVFGPQRRAVVVQVFRDLSVLLRPGGQFPTPYPDFTGINDRYVEIEIRESDIGMGFGSPAHASQWFLDIQTGITYGCVWEYINTGVDPYLFIANPNFPAVPSYHGFMRFNFDNVGFTYNLDLNNPAPTDLLDLYSITLHEIIHTLGFGSLVAADGTSRLTSQSPGRYSLWDTYLRVNPSQTKVLDFNSDIDCYDSKFNPALNSNDILGDCSSINMEFLYPGSTVLNNVYTDPVYGGGGSVFSHFNCNNDDGYVMNSGISTGYNQRMLHLTEVQALCALGYDITGVYGDGGAVINFDTNSTTWNYSNACPESRIIAGANDFGPWTSDMSINAYSVTCGDAIDIVDITLNDFPENSEICCVEIVAGDGVIPPGSVTSTGFTYQTGGVFMGEAVIKYRPINSIGQRGNITYVFIQVIAPPLPPCQYTSLCNENLICHGDFEGYNDGSGMGQAVGLSYFCIEGTSANSTDIYNVNGNTFLGISAHINEACVFELLDPIHNGETVNISFLGSRDHNSPNPATFTCNFFGSLNSPCNTPQAVSNVSGSNSTLCPTYTPILMGSQLITNQAGGSFPNYTNPNFTMFNLPTYTNNTGQDLNFIMLYPNQTSGFILIDNIVVNKISNNEILINSSPNFSSPLCQGDNFQFDYVVCATGGIPTLPVTLVYEDQFGNIPTGLTIDPSSDFDPLTGEIIIQPTDWNAITGCVNLSLVLSVNGNALPGSIISNIINVQEGACISGDPVEDVVEISNTNTLEIIKDFNVVGNLVTYTIEVSNLHSTNTISNIIIEDNIPVELININAPDFTIVGPNITNTTPLTIGPLNSSTLTFTAEINSNTTCQTIIENCVSIISADDVCSLPIETCVSFLFQNPSDVDIDLAQVSCFGHSDGEATINVSGGTPDYLITVNGPVGNIPVSLPSGTPSNVILQNLISGNYSVTVTDNNGCIAINSFSITQPSLLLASVQSLSNQICTTFGSATINATGGTPDYDYNWPSTAGGVYNNSANELIAGSYTVTVVDANSCETQIDVDIIDASINLNVNSFVHQNPICNGEESGIIKVIVENGTPDFTIDWGSASITTSDYTTLINSLSADTYNFTVTDANGCIGETTTTLLDNLLVTATIDSYSDVTCYGNEDGWAHVQAGGGVAPYTYLWDDSQEQTTPTISGLSGGTYNVTVTDNLGCEAYTNVTIWESTNIKPQIDEIIHVTCFGNCDGSATVSVTGGVPPYTFEWSDPDNQVGEQAIDLCAGNYTVTVTDNNGCAAEIIPTATIYENPELEATITSNTISCFGINTGTATVTPSGGTGSYTYLWSDDQTTPTAINLAPGAYNVTVTDDNNCEAYANVTIGQNSEMSAWITEDSDNICYNNPIGSATVEASGGQGNYTYEWNDQNNQVTPTATGLIGGIYNVTVSDANNCEAHTSVTIAGPSEEFIASGAFTEIACFGGTSEVTITATGGTEPYTGTGVFTVLAGTHIYTVTDANDCITTTTITIIEPSELTISLNGTNDNTCYGDEYGVLMVSAEGGTLPYEYSIIEGVWQESAVFNGLAAGTYIVNVQDANECTAESEPIDINQPDEIMLFYNSTNNSCSGNCLGEITANPTGGTGNFTYTWTWTVNDEWQNPVYTQGISGLCDGEYYLTVAEDNNPDCFQTGAVTIDSENVTPALPQLNIPECLYVNNVFQFNDIINNSDPSLTWTWQIGEEVFVTNENTLNYEFPDYGYYWISLEVSSNEDCGTESTPAELVFVNSDICACNDDPLVGGDIDYDYPDGITIDGSISSSLPIQNAGTTQTIRVNGNIVIEQTRHLTLEENLTIEFSPNSRIIVMDGATLIIRDNVTLTSISQGSCKDNMWQGIEVWGDPDNPHDDDKQGLVIIEGTVSNNYENVNISNAHIGILLGARNMNYILDPVGDPNPFDESKGSGFIRTAYAKTNFTDNGIGIKFLPREPMVDIGNEGGFWSGNNFGNCHFMTTLDEELNDDKYSIYTINSYPNPQNPWAGYANPYQRTDVGVYANGIKGLDIEDCTFERMQYGILSYDAKYNVYNSIFNTAIFGIKCENTSSSFLANHEISNCFFDNIPGFVPSQTSKTRTAAIYIRAGYNDYIHDNIFGLSGSIQEYNHFGIVTSSTSMFDITENSFNNFNRGIVVTKSGENGGFIGAGLSSTETDWEGNRFNNSWRSITTQSQNPKLRLKCNTSINNNSISEEFDVNYYNTGLLANQGSATFNPIFSQSEKFPAGNEFYPDDEPEYKTLKTNSSYTYYRHSGPDAVIPISDVSGQSYVNINPTNAEDKESNSRACPDPYWGLHIDDVIELPQLVIFPNSLIMSYPFNTLNSLSNTTDSLKTILEEINNNLDDGRTYELLNDIYGNTSAGKLKNKLISCSPLSDTVIYAILTEYPLSHGNFKNLMQLNLPVNKDHQDLLYTVLLELPEGISKQLIALQAFNPNSNSPGNIEQQIKDIEIETQLLYNRLVRLLTDTTHNRYDDAIKLVKTNETVPAYKTLTGTYISVKEYELANNELLKIPIDNQANEDFSELNELLLSYYTLEKSLYSMDSAEIAFLYELAYRCPENIASANAQSVLNMLYREEFEECPSQIGTRNATIYDAHLYAPSEEIMSILGDNYPDPADNYTIMPYNLGEYQTGIITIIDQLGRVVKSYNVTNNERELNVNTVKLKPGIYSYTLYNKNGITLTKKFAIYR